ncbi:hypothetical protein [Halobacillus aidingensis]|uniref:Transglycosylase n=1 Tax=Halobacillus aidingensis TaxID=240303 RepID=A0A1H0MGW0_HALAD|nr:hypothetical protein [Halobacillus aidingensis]SDO79669.1 hypothetical protein SAMN05421677_10835 [Halobacillus aidingensis]
MKVTCDDGCKKEFNIPNLISSYINDDVERTFFRCPACGQEYDSFYTNSQAREIRTQVNKLRSKSKLSDKEERKLRLYTDNLQAIMASLREEYGAR